MSALTINGWSLDASGDEPRIRDIDLAERLGYERPTDIRYLVKRLAKDGKISDSDIVRTVRRNAGERGRPATEYWLTEEAALLVVTRSETAIATALTREIISVFRAYYRGQLAPVVQPAAIPAEYTTAIGELRATIATLAARVEALSRPALPEASPEIGHAEARRLSRQIGEVAELCHLVNPDISLSSHAGRVRYDLACRLNWNGPGKTWAAFPRVRIQDLRVALEEARNSARRLAGDRASHQLRLVEGES